jgi:NAD+ kinase
MLAGRYLEERRTMLEIVVEREGIAREVEHALNDVAVNRGAAGSMVEFAVEIDGRFAYAMRADGIIVATPTGSTAYALSAGGPILDPRLSAFALVPVAPHALTHRPIAIADLATIRITVARGSDATVHCDGHAHFPLAEGDRIAVRRAPHPARFLHPEGHDHFAMLREKLHWSETPERLKARP